jgi:hypothetical protein
MLEDDVYIIADEQGWSVDTLFQLCLDFLIENDEGNSFLVYLQTKADEENSDSQTLEDDEPQY